MNKFFTVILCFSFAAAALSKHKDNGPLVLKNYTNFTTIDPLFTADAGLPLINIENIEEEYLIEENIETNVVLADIKTEEEFNGGITIDPNDFLQANEFDDSSTDIIIEVVEEEEDSGEFTESLISNPGDFLQQQQQDELLGVKIIVDEEGEFEYIEEFSVEEEISSMGNFLFLI